MPRDEQAFSITSPSGVKKDYRLVPFVTPDDLMVLSMKAIAAELKFGIKYVSPSGKAVRDHVVLSRVTYRS